MKVAIYLATTNDRNGNPRRGWLIVETTTGASVEFVDEGYLGHAALVKRYGPNTGARLAQTAVGRINVTPGEYRAQRAR
jgi:hypothetical protein